MEDKYPSYIIISPVKDEEDYVTATLESVVNQTIKPWKWVIVDDGSSDRTPEILQSYRQMHPWIEILKTDRRASRQPGLPVVHAFYRGFELIRKEQYDVLVKLDCDLSFGPDYFEKLLLEFKKDVRLGIASGIYLENHGKGWEPVKMPYYHTAGACKLIRKECFHEIGGFIPAKGWDTVDEIRAQMKGWQTRHYPERVMYHLKNEGSGIGFLRTNAMHGEIFYKTGGSKLFFLGKVLHRMVKGKPFFGGGLMLLYGYLNSVICRSKKIVTSEEARFYSKLLLSRLWGAKR